MNSPNVLLVLTDDQRFDALSALAGDPELARLFHTPNLDRLVERGTAMTQCRIQGGSSPAVCMPSRAMLHTGRSLYRITRQGQTIDPAHVTLAEHLRARGMATWACGKQHNGVEAFARGFTGGDELFFGGMADHWNVPAYRFDPTGRYDATMPQCPDPMRSAELHHRPGDHIHNGRHSSEILADAAVAQLHRATGQDRPWFMYLSTLAPHDPRTMPAPWLEAIDPRTVPLPPNAWPCHPFNNGELRIRDEMLAEHPRSESEVRGHLAAYAAMIRHLDHELGRVFEALDATGQSDRTIVALAGDNGLAVGQHGLMGKQSLYEHSVRVPLILAGPGVPRGERRDAPCHLHDLFPTLCDLVDAPIPGSVEGVSFASGLHDATQRPRDRLLLAYRGLMRGVTDGRRKLIEYAVEGRRRTQLFDLVEDPWEQDDLSEVPERSGEIESLRAALRGWRDLDDDQPGQGLDFWRCFDADDGLSDGGRRAVTAPA